MFGKLLLTLQQFIEALVKQTPDIWLCEIRDALSTICGVVVGLATVWSSVGKVRFGPVLSKFLRTPNWTNGPVQPNARTLNRTYVQVQNRSSSGSGAVRTRTEPNLVLEKGINSKFSCDLEQIASSCPHRHCHIPNIDYLKQIEACDMLLGLLCC
jgi:hypothetical protein